MFFIHTLEGYYRDLSLEAIIHRQDVRGVHRDSPSRKIIRDESDGGHGDSYERKESRLSYAEKTYRESLKLKNELEPILHAWQIMSSPVKTISSSMTIKEAWELFVHEKVRHMPVLSEKGTTEGIISDRDLLKRLIITGNRVEGHTDERVASIMIREVITASRVTDIRRIALVMFNLHIGTMPILDDEKKLAGIITRSDILHALINHAPLKLWG